MFRYVTKCGRTCITRSLAALVLLLALSANAMAVPAEKNAFNRIKLLERQILLSEQIGVSVCLMLANIKAASQSDKARGAADLFDTVQRALRTGDENMAILAETSPSVLAALDEIDALFYTFRAATLQLVHNDLHSVPAGQIMRLDDPIMQGVRNAVDVVALEYGADAGDAAARNTRSLARRQIMLAQRIAKTVCYLHIDIARASMGAEMAQTIKTFEDTQNALRTGRTGQNILPPPKASALKKIKAVDALWAELMAQTAQIPANGAATEETLLKVIEIANKLLFKTKQVARGYK